MFTLENDSLFLVYFECKQNYVTHNSSPLYCLCSRHVLKRLNKLCLIHLKRQLKAVSSVEY